MLSYSAFWASSPTAKISWIKKCIPSVMLWSVFALVMYQELKPHSVAIFSNEAPVQQHIATPQRRGAKPIPYLRNKLNTAYRTYTERLFRIRQQVNLIDQQHRRYRLPPATQNAFQFPNRIWSTQRCLGLDLTP